MLKGLLLHLPGVRRLDFAIRGWRRYLYAGERELHLLRYLVDPERAAVDIGANRGYYTYWLQRHADHVYAYEPNPINLPYLRGAHGNVTVRTTALSDHQGEATLHVRMKRFRGLRGLLQPPRLENRTGTLNTVEASAEQVAYPVTVGRLDDEQLPPVGFIKIDVEGHEFAALAGAQALIARDRPVMLIEIEERHNGRPILESLAEVEAMGYEALALTPRGMVRAHTLDPARWYTAHVPGQAYVVNFLFFPIKGLPQA